MSGIDELLAVATAYAKAEEIDLNTVSWRALGDSKKLPAIVAGADIQLRRFERTMQWFSDHWPTTAAWPDGVSRPALSPDLEKAAS